MNNLLVGTFVFFILTCIYHICPVVSSGAYGVSRFRQILAENVMFENADVDFMSVTRLKCAMTCASRPLCLSYSYHGGTGRCMVFDRRVIFGQQMVGAAGFQHYWKMQDNCPTDAGYSLVSGVCVQVVGTKKTWPDAQTTCEAAGGHLYVGDSPTKMSTLKTAISTQGTTSLDYRVGAFQQAGVWSWITGPDVTIQTWSNNQPGTDPTKSCAETALSQSDRITSDRCSQIDRYVCEVPLGF